MTAYQVARLLREHGEATGAENFGFLDNFYTMTTELDENGNSVDVIRFKKHSFEREGLDVCSDIRSTHKDKLLIAFQIGLHKGDPIWRGNC